MPQFSSSTKKPPSQRQLRVGEEIRHILSSILMRGDVRDPDINSVPITVSEVRISPDLKNATAYIMPLGGGNREKILAALERLAPQIRSLVSKQMSLRYAPRVGFRIDETFDEASRINSLLQKPDVQRDLKPTQEN